MEQRSCQASMTTGSPFFYFIAVLFRNVPFCACPFLMRLLKKNVLSLGFKKKHTYIYIYIYEAVFMGSMHWAELKTGFTFTRHKVVTNTEASVNLR